MSIKCIEKQTAKNAGKRALIMTGILPVEKPRKARAKGYKCNREEDRLRPLIVKELRKEGYTVFRLEPFQKGKFGVSDLLVMGKGVSVFLEIKKPGGVQSDSQKEFHQLCIDCSCYYFITTSPEDAVDIMRCL